MSPALIALDVGGDADAWRDAGFTVESDCVTLGSVALRIDAAIDGIAQWHFADEPSAERPTTEHPNTATALDHVVVFTNDPDRTILTYADMGLDVRRVRDVGGGRTQTFFRAGEPIIELVGPIAGIEGEQFWGLAITVADLDACAALLGDRLSAVKDAVQPGRRIATLRHEACGISVPIAFMSTRA